MGAWLTFQWDIFDIERMIEDKMIYSSFFSYNIDIDLSFRAQNFNLLIETFFVFFFIK
jgi:hypothetical protein